MILHCNYEELSALSAGAHAVLERPREGRGAVAAPPASRVRVEALLPRLRGDLTIETLWDQGEVQKALEVIVQGLHLEVKAAVVAFHPAHETAVSAYFEYAHSLAVLARVREMGREMAALIELVTGEPPTEELAHSFQFPD